MMIRCGLQQLSTRLRYGHYRLFSAKTACVSVNCRRATVDDFEAVVNINENVLRGRDYVPSTYHSMLTDPNMSAYVGEVENRIVAFACARLLDGGRTFLLSAGRVNVAHQGQGIMGQLLRHIKARYSSRTGILHDIFATDGGHPILSQVSKQCISEVLTRRVHCFTFPVNDLPVEALPLQDTQVSTPTNQHLVKLMSPQKTNRHLFPGGRLVVDWIPLRTDPHNVPFMNSNACYHTGKYPEQECLSFGTGYQCKLGLAYNLDIYGSHPKSLRAHVHRHLLEIAHSVQRNQGLCSDVNKAQSTNYDQIHLLIFTCMSVDTAIHETLHKLGFSESEWPVKTQVVMEKCFTKE